MKKIILLIVILILSIHSEVFAKSIFEAKIEMPKIEKSWTQNQQTQFSSGLSFNTNFPDIEWWEGFQDKNLNALIEDAFKWNPDINIAKTNIEQAKGMVKYVFANELPHADIGSTYLRSKFSENVVLPGTDSNSGFLGNGKAFNFFSTPINVSYEVDYLRKNHDKTESAKKLYKAAQYEEQAVKISLISEVASTYFNLIEMDKLLELQENKIMILNDILGMKEAKYHKGFIDFEDVETTRTEIKQNENTYNDLLIQQSLLANKLAILVGHEPANLSSFKRSKWTAKLVNTDIINGGISSDLLTRRPDIMAAESQLQSSLIDIKVARKEFLPTINLSLRDLGFMATSFNKLFDSNSFNYMIGGILNQSIFNGGATVANLKIKKATADIRLQEYRKTILTALKEVEDSFVKINNDYNSLKNQEKNIESNQSILTVSKAKYSKGFVDYITVREQEKQYYDNQMGLISTQSKFLMDKISLYKDLGGGY